MAEFLVHEEVPLELITQVGVYDAKIKEFARRSGRWTVSVNVEAGMVFLVDDRVRARGNLLELPMLTPSSTRSTPGVMGKGIALQFKRAFPDNYKQYRARAKAARSSSDRCS